MAMPFRILSGWLGGVANAQPPTLRRRPSGIRGTDETTTLPVSNAMLEHLSASCVNHDDRVLRNFSDSVDSLTDIEDEIDELKAAVQSMRAGTSTPLKSNVSAAGAVTNNTTADSTQVYGTDNGPVTSDNHSDDMVHIHTQKPALPTRIPEPAKRAPSPSPRSKEFPPLGGPAALESSLPQAIHKTTRKRSYAIAAASISKGVVLKVSKGSIKTHVLTSPEKSTAKTQPSPPAGKPNTSSPRFAQPTQATVRRAGETLRRDSVADLAALSAAGNGSMKGNPPSFETEKRATQRRKRTSLPQGWLAEPQAHANPIADAAAARPDTTPSLQVAASSPQSPNSKRSKTLSYMSPTKATQRRQIGAVASTAGKPAPSRVQTAKLKINTNVPASNIATRSGSIASTALSFGNSEVVTSSPKGLKPRYRPTRTPVSSLDNTVVATTETQYVLPDTAEAKAAVKGLTVLPSPLPPVQNAVLTRRVSRNDLLGPIAKKLAEADLFRLQNELVADVAARTTAAANPVKRDFAAARALSQNLPRIDQASSMALSASAHDPFIVLRPPLRELSNSTNAQRPLGNAQQAMNYYNDSTKSHYLRSSADHSGLRGRSSAQIAEALNKGLAHNDTVDESRYTSNALRELRQAGTAGPNKENAQQSSLDPAIIRMGPLSNPTLAKGTGAAPENRPSSLRATASEFRPSWLSPQSTSSTCAQAETVQPSLYTTPPNQTGPFASFPTSIVPTAQQHASTVPIWQVLPDHIPTPSTINISPPTAFISPHSTDTSPPLSNLQNSLTLPTSSSSSTNSTRWRIRAQNPRRPYMWTGSDGREIKYIGHGPDAERDPNSPVSYFDARRGGRVYESGSLREGKENGVEVEGAPRMPRRMRVWSEAGERVGWAAQGVVGVGCGMCCHGVGGNGIGGFGAGMAMGLGGL